MSVWYVLVVPYTVLIVEDEEPLGKLYKSIFEKAGYNVVVANDGQAAIDYMNSHKPDALILDIFMPVVNGITVLKTIKTKQGNIGLPVIVVTNVENFSIENEISKVGVTAYILKSGSKLEDIVKKVSEAIQRH